MAEVPFGIGCDRVGGSAGTPPKKLAERRQRGRSRSDMRADITPTTAVPVVAPEGDSSWSPLIAAEWLALWSASLAANFQPSDVPGLRRLFSMRSRLDAALARADAEPEVAGSTGQVRVTPRALHRDECAVLIVMSASCERTFGQRNLGH